MRMSGRYRVKHSRNGKILHAFQVNNVMMFEGVETWARSVFEQATAETWYMGLADGLPDPMFLFEPEFSQGDEANFIGAVGSPTTDWDEIANYSDATRPAWDPDTFQIVASPGIRVRNSVDTLFNIDDHGLIGGVFLISDNVKLANNGKLLSGARFPFDVRANVGDKMEIEYEIFITFS